MRPVRVAREPPTICVEPSCRNSSGRLPPVGGRRIRRWTDGGPGLAAGNARRGLDAIIAWTDELGAFASYLFAFGAPVGGDSRAHDDVARSAVRSRLSRRGGQSSEACVVALVGAGVFRARFAGARHHRRGGGERRAGALGQSRKRSPFREPEPSGCCSSRPASLALLHLAGSLLAWYAGRARRSKRPRSSARASGNGIRWFFDTLTLVVAFAWLTTRGRKKKSSVWAAPDRRSSVGCLLAGGRGANRGARDNPPSLDARHVPRRRAARAAGHRVRVAAVFASSLENVAPPAACASRRSPGARGQMPAIAGSIALSCFFARPRDRRSPCPRLR